MSSSKTPQPVKAQYLALTFDSEAILARFEHAANWQERYREIMLLGKTLPTLDDALRVEQAQVRGCESSAWLYHINIEGKNYYLADSDARIVKGLIALLLAMTHGQSAQTIAALDINAYFDKLGLTGQLSPSRTNGLFALAAAIKSAAE
ncbi:SufE family protein [Shewanella psychrotolerans]|uniref:SufE family protein n=1 Tax=Shewanella psychrotolerans TaxID=2864206 RepID=UPI001C662186|nr:SufE family protein [Shewanella psychrotolerans]QYK00832.1 SufE family protein [Shewanella psychrotolerans]